MKKYLFVDRDGTLIVEPPTDHQVDSLEKLEFMPGVFQHLGRIVRELDFTLVMVTNQDGLGTASFPEATFWPAHDKMLKAFANEGITFSEVLIDRSFAHEGLPTRKPGTAMLTRYVHGNADLAQSYVIGDRVTDVELATNLGCKAIYLGAGPVQGDALCVPDWEGIAHHLLRQPRNSHVLRHTTETAIEVELSLDGTGKADIRTGIGFLDHMLEQVAKHGGLDLRIHAQGDLHIDEHHTAEDVALALGEALTLALGSKRGIGRYGFLLPMDDCQAQVALDLGGRPWLVWEAEFRRERIGDLPTEMLMHFFKSLSDAAKANLHLRATGDNEHHKAEAIFKGLGRALRMAVARTGSSSIPSTKGVL